MRQIAVVRLFEFRMQVKKNKTPSSSCVGVFILKILLCRLYFALRFMLDTTTSTFAAALKCRPSTWHDCMAPVHNVYCVFEGGCFFLNSHPSSLSVTSTWHDDILPLFGSALYILCWIRGRWEHFGNFRHFFMQISINW